MRVSGPPPVEIANSAARRLAAVTSHLVRDTLRPMFKSGGVELLEIERRHLNSQKAASQSQTIYVYHGGGAASARMC